MILDPFLIYATYGVTHELAKKHLEEDYQANKIDVTTYIEDSNWIESHFTKYGNLSMKYITDHNVVIVPKDPVELYYKTPTSFAVIPTISPTYEAVMAFLSHKKNIRLC